MTCNDYPIIDDDESIYDGDLEVGMDVTDFTDPADDIHIPSDFDF